MCECATECVTECVTDSVGRSLVGLFCRSALPDGNPYKGYGSYKDQVNFNFLLMLASSCGLPAGTVKLTPPALTTCEGAGVKYNSLSM